MGISWQLDMIGRRDSGVVQSERFQPQDTRLRGKVTLNREITRYARNECASRCFKEQQRERESGVGTRAK